MSLAVKPDGSAVISAVGAGDRNEHLLVFTIQNPTNPNAPGYNVLDVSAGIGGDLFLVQSA